MLDHLIFIKDCLLLVALQMNKVKMIGENSRHSVEKVNILKTKIHNESGQSPLGPDDID